MPTLDITQVKTRITAALKTLPHNSKAKELITLLLEDLATGHSELLFDNANMRLRIDNLERDEAQHHAQIKRQSQEYDDLDRRCIAITRERDLLRAKVQDLEKACPMIQVVVSMNAEQRKQADFNTPGGWGKIPPIKALREKTGLGLADAKYAVESMMCENVKTYEVRESVLTDSEFTRYFTVARA